MASTSPEPLTESEYIQAAKEYQQNHYELCCDWNKFERHELEYLRDLIGYGLYGLPSCDDKDKQENVATDAIVNERCFSYTKEQCEHINMLYEKCIKYSNYENQRSDIYCSIIYNVIYYDDQQSKTEIKSCTESELVPESDNRDATRSANVKIFPVPVFKVKWYGNTKTENESEKIYYIDNNGRVYEGFVDYLKANTLPKCTMVLPKDGRYQIDPASCTGAAWEIADTEQAVSTVWLEILPSPAHDPANKVMLGCDIASAFLSTVGIGVGFAAVFTPIGAGVALASGVAGGASGVWTAFRSGQQLVDRSHHDESINVTDRTALGAWIGIGGSTLGVAASGGTALLARAIRTGTTIGRAAMITFDAVQIGNLIVNGIGIGYKGYDIYANYKEKEEISMQDAVLFAAHVFFFYNTVMNAQLARNLIQNSQAKILKDYETSLRSNRHRREFQRMARNTRAAGTNDVSSNGEIIRGITKIANKDEFFESMVRNRKAFSASGAKATFSDGKVIVNSVFTIDPVEFSKLPKNVRVDVIRNVSSVSSENPGSIPTTGSLGVDFRNVPATQANEAAGPKLRASSGVEPNNAAATETKKAALTAPKRSAPVEPKKSTSTLPKYRPNETSYKNFNNSNRTILDDFCLRHPSTMLRTAPPKITDFQNVLNDLRGLTNYAKIFFTLLEAGYRIYQALPRDMDTEMGKLLGLIVDYIWDTLKSHIRNNKLGYLISDPEAARVVGILVTKLMIQVEEKVDAWVKGFKKWLETKFPQTISI